MYQPQHTYDALPSTPDTRDFLAAPVDAAALPDTVQLPQVPVLDQGQEGSCVGHGCAGARETLDAVAGKPLVPLSRAFVYYEARKLEHSTRQDAGAEVRDGCKVLSQLGVCPEADFPYKVGGYAKAPPKADLAKSAPYKIATYTRLTNATQVRAALARGHAVVIGISVYQSFEQNVGPDGLIPVPNKRKEQLLGGHCLYQNGYKPNPKKPGKFLFRTPNSWGEDAWGDRGCGWMDEDYMDDPELCSDMWEIALD
jgi:C1A family cysteine protease